MTNHIDWHPSASWKLSAISTPLSVHTMRVSARGVSFQCSLVDKMFTRLRALLFLKAILLDYLTLKEEAFRLILRLDDNAGFFGLAFLDLHRGGNMIRLVAS